MSFLSAKDQISVMRVCQHLRAHVIDAPRVWTHVDQIGNPTALLFVLERAKNIPVDITNLSVENADDVRFETVAAHMHHIRTLGLDLGQSFGIFRTESRAHIAFTTTAPLLQLLSFCGRQFVTSNQPLAATSNFSISESTMPRLSSFELRGVELTTVLLQKIQSLSTFSFSGGENFQHGQGSMAMCASRFLHNLTTINLELSGWNTAAGYPELGPAVKQINIRWTKPSFFMSREAIPNQAAWKSIRTVRVAHMCDSPGKPPEYDWDRLRDHYGIPETAVPYQSLSFRALGASDRRVHVRAIDRDGRERIVCGLHPSTVENLVTHISKKELSTITITTTALILQALASVHLPALRCIRIVVDTSKIRSLVYAMPNISKLERLEFSQEVDSAASEWTTTVITRTISRFVAAAICLQEVVFLGFSPEPQCVTLAGMFSQRVVVDPNWQEPKSEREWFTEPPFKWDCMAANLDVLSIFPSRHAEFGLGSFPVGTDDRKMGE